ncbi:HipA family kinase [Prosthecomicrobium hirschii]|uniref:HipA family kinase n=1 Tax=Prosthecodimorpha hirschii TaxID=665126 RepID=UPI00221FDCA5|nr:HipA family kinase [Prosthecomicrobium hirschii]MCW1843455.1 hypothetical protein [Prosthecomicrobium hirschii]
MEIVEIVGQAKHGVTMPLRCRVEDGSIYYVKGPSAGYSSLTKELVCGRLAHAFGLPVPEIAVLTVPRAFRGIGGAERLGLGPVFGSKEIPQAFEVSYSDLADIPDQIAKQILFFDRWILNADRILSKAGGNPNIIRSRDGFFVIDHHNAFDPDAGEADFWKTHMFGGLRERSIDKAFQVQFSDCCAICLEAWDDIIGAVPERWLYIDDLMTVECQPELAAMRAILDRVNEAEFWSWI